MDFKIEKGVEVLPVVRKTKWSDFPLKEMEIGDSIFIPEEFAAVKVSSKVITERARRLGLRVMARPCDGGCRVWRIEPKQPLLKVVSK